MQNSILLVFQIIIGCILSGLILMQSKGTGLGRSFGGNQAYSSKRGMEKIVFNITIALAVLFLISSIIQLMI